MNQSASTHHSPKPDQQTGRKTWHTPHLTIMPVLEITESGAFTIMPPNEDTFYRPS